VRLDNRFADRQAHPHARVFRGRERVEKTVHDLRGNTWPVSVTDTQSAAHASSYVWISIRFSRPDASFVASSAFNIRFMITC